MSALAPLSATAEAVLAALAQFQFLTAKQMLRLGVTSEKTHLYDTLRGLKGGRPASIVELSFGVKPGVGRLSSLYALTRHGAEILSLATRQTEPILVRANVRTFANDYFHKVGCIDFAIAVHQWAAEHHNEVTLFDTYYDPIRRQATRGKRLRPQTTIDLPTGHLIPDAIFALTEEGGVKRLFTYEFYRGVRTDRVAKQLEAYLAAIETNCVQKAYDFTKAVRILLTFDNRRALELVCERLRPHPAFERYRKWFFLATNEEAAEDFIGAWQRFDGEVQKLF